MENVGTDVGGTDLLGWVDTLTRGTAGILGALKSGQAKTSTSTTSNFNPLLIGGAVLAVILILVIGRRS